MTLTFDQNTYCNLLAQIAPIAIETEKEYERMVIILRCRLACLFELFYPQKLGTIKTS